MHTAELAPFVVAHRGWQQHYPENSLIGLAAALKVGSRWLEIDVQLTADHVPVISHDSHLQRVGSHFDLLSHPWVLAQQQAIHEPARFGTRYAGETLPPLTGLIPLLNAYPLAQCFVELKEESIQAFGAHRCLLAVQQALAPIAARCVLISFDHHTLSLAVELGFQRIAPVLQSWQQRKLVASKLPSSEFLFCDCDTVNSEYIHSDIPVALYEISTLEQARLWLARGAQLIETFACGELLQLQNR